MEIEYSLDSNVAYLRFNKNKAANTIPVTPTLNVDVDEKGKVVGIEYLGSAREDLDLKNLKLSGFTPVISHATHAEAEGSRRKKPDSRGRIG